MPKTIPSMNQSSLFLFIILFLGHFHLRAQIVSGETPPSFQHNINTVQLIQHEVQKPIISLQKPDKKVLEKEDAIADLQKDIPYRFGVVNEVNYHLNNAGEWLHYNNGKSVFQLLIKAPGALSLNLNFSKFHLSPNAKLFFYNEQKTDVLGAITESNNKEDSIFSIRPLKGDVIHLELYVPTAEINQNIMIIESIVYGYRNLQKDVYQAIGGSDYCEINISCPEGDKWEDVKRSVVMILNSSNSRQCTGTLLNNTARDSVPYVITAEHCGMGSGSIFIFNYESSNCDPSINPGMGQTISHSTFKASLGESDFLLLELSQKPPPSYEAYYAGWDARDTVFLNGTAIHHPKRDVKKISYTGDTLISDAYNDDLFSDTHWMTPSWHYGATESGSSGSGLFNEDQHFIGQLQGGGSLCGNNFPDFYGKTSHSWEGRTQNNRQLKHWLDPINSNQKILEGMDTKTPAYSNDLKLIGIHGLKNYYCDSTLRLMINFKNMGLNPVTQAEILLKINNWDTLLTWTGNLNRSEIGKIQLDNIAVDHGANELQAIVHQVNNQSDAQAINDTAFHWVHSNQNPKMVEVEIKTDNYGSETAWNITTSKGIVVSEGGYYFDRNGGNVFNHQACLYDSCFTFNLIDLAGDGFNGYYGNGYALVTYNGDTLVYENQFRQFSKSIRFCLDSLVGITKNKKIADKVLIYPNPVLKNRIINLKNTLELNELVLYDVNGRKIDHKFLSQKQGELKIQLNVGLNSGIYFIKLVNSSGEVHFQKLILTE